MKLLRIVQKLYTDFIYFFNIFTIFYTFLRNNSSGFLNFWFQMENFGFQNILNFRNLNKTIVKYKNVLFKYK